MHPNISKVQQSITLFCFPFAGGSSYSFNTFGPNLSPGIELNPVELPGRGKRSRENLMYDANAVADDILKTIEPVIASGNPYAIFGHSMGALLGYIVIRKLIERKLQLPVHFFASGRGGPSYDDGREEYYKLPKKEFREKLRELGGSPKEVLDHEQLMDFFEPILRADFQVVETYEHKIEEPFDVPVSVMTGKEDKIDLEGAGMWQNETTAPIKIYEFDGGHFFLFDHVKEICGIISAVISASIKEH